MAFETVIFKVDGPVATITMNRPDVANAQNTQLIDDLDAAFDAADEADEVRVVVLAANGKHFSSGHDLKALVVQSEGDQWGAMRETPEGKFRHEEVMYYRRCRKIRDFRKRRARFLCRGRADAGLHVRPHRGRRQRNFPKPGVAHDGGWC